MKHSLFLFAVPATLCFTALPTLKRQLLRLRYRISQLQSPPPLPSRSPLLADLPFPLNCELESKIGIGSKTPGFKDHDTFSGTQLRLNALNPGKRYDIGIDVQQVILTGVGANTIAPAPQGALGLPGSYRAANGGKDGALSLKQAFIRLKTRSVTVLACVLAASNSTTGWRQRVPIRPSTGSNSSASPSA